MASQDSWTGWIVFAGFVIIIVGVMDVLQGFIAILEDEYVVATPKGLAIFDVTAWGWTSLIWGALLVIAGLGLLGGAGWARWLAIFGVAINAIQQVAFLSNYPQAYPLWNILIVALNIVVLYALTARWEGYTATLRAPTTCPAPAAAPPGGGTGPAVLLVGLVVHLRDLDRDLERGGDLARRGCDPRRADDRCDRRKHATDLLGVDTHLACNGEVHQVRDRRRIDGDKRRDAYERKRLRVQTRRFDRIRRHARQQVEYRRLAG